MNRQKLAICDGDKVYCRRLDEYLHGNLKLEFDIYSFTDSEILLEFAKESRIALLIISEKMYEKLKDTDSYRDFKNILILDEGLNGGEKSETVSDAECRIEHLSKYQEAAKIIEKVIDFCVDNPDDFEGVNTKADAKDGRVYGFYSPISRCGQTSLAISVAKKLAETSKVIFLSFESFSSLPWKLGISSKEDITDAIYYAECEKTKMPIYLEKIKKTKDGVDYIFPAGSASQLKEIGFEKIRELLMILTRELGYEYIVMDMTEYPGGFFDILMMCERIFTIGRNTFEDSFRQKAYDEALLEIGYGAVKAKTVLCQIPENADERIIEKYAYEILESEAV